MRLNIPAIILLLLGSQTESVFAEQSKNVCKLPTGSFKNSCSDLLVEQCSSTIESDDTFVCKLSTNCQPNNPELNKHLNQVVYRPGLTETLINVDGVIQGASIDKPNTKLILASYTNCQKVALPASNTSVMQITGTPSLYNQGYALGHYLMMQLRAR